MKKYVMAGLIALVFVLSVVQSFQISAIKGELTGNAVNAGTSGGETYEEMMAEMHPELAGTTGSSGSSAPTMVGGC